ncbi:hypothetical protein V1512DRAFT_264890 [Lipomyces arxii]|uniref:uncharacterized protein n=1 Tax=Lipomyces arxii TaxID=56418 RepID=UPI0034CFE116
MSENQIGGIPRSFSEWCNWMVNRFDTLYESLRRDLHSIYYNEPGEQEIHEQPEVPIAPGGREETNDETGKEEFQFLTEQSNEPEESHIRQLDHVGTMSKPEIAPYGTYLPNNNASIDGTASVGDNGKVVRKRRLTEQLRRRRQAELRFGASRYQTPSLMKMTDSGAVSLASVYPVYSASRITKYKSPFKKLGSGERLRTTLVAYGADSMRDSARLTSVRNRLMNGLKGTMIDNGSPAVPTPKVRRNRSLRITESQSVDELLRQLISEGNATDFPSWKAIQQRRAERAKAIEEMRRPRKELIIPLSVMQQRKVDDAMHIRDGSRTLCSAFRIDISAGDIQTLGDRRWLNDNVIDFYLALVTQRSKDKRANDRTYPRSFAWTTHFYTTLSSKGYPGVARWGKRKQLALADTDYLFVPINVHSTHWCVSVVNFLKKRFEYYDSLGGGPGNAFRYLREYVINEAATQNAMINDVAGWSEYVSKDSPMQENGYDCGVFTCKTVEVLARDGPLSFSQRDMPILRRRMAYEILEAKLLS